MSRFHVYINCGRCQAILSTVPHEGNRLSIECRHCHYVNEFERPDGERQWLRSETGGNARVTPRTARVDAGPKGDADSGRGKPETARGWLERTNRDEAVTLLRRFASDARQLVTVLDNAANAIERGDDERALENLLKIERSIDGLGEGFT